MKPEKQSVLLIWTPLCLVLLSMILGIYSFSGASTAEEDERDLSKVSSSMELFELYTKGFIEGCQGSLTEAELEMLPVGAMTMTYECGMRFLTDYLEGDHYFKVHRDGHNLDRAQNSIHTGKRREEKLETMNAIVKKYGFSK